MAHRITARTPVVLLLGALVLSGCSTTVTAAGDSPSANPVAPPQKPAALMEDTGEGLEAAVRYWVDLQNHAIETGETRAWAEFSAEDCRYCQELIAEIDEAYASGGRIEGGKLTATRTWGSTDAFDAGPGQDAQALATAELERTAGTAYNSTGKATREFEKVSCEDFDENWKEMTHDKDGTFVGSICDITVPHPVFDQATGWHSIGVAFTAQ